MKKESETARNPLSIQAFNLVKTSLMQECEKAIQNLLLEAENYSLPPSTSASCTDCSPKNFPSPHSLEAGTPSITNYSETCSEFSNGPSNTPAETLPPSVHWTKSLANPCNYIDSDSSTLELRENCNIEARRQNQVKKSSTLTMGRRNSGNVVKQTGRNLLAIMAKRTDSGWGEAQHSRAGQHFHFVYLLI